MVIPKELKERFVQMLKDRQIIVVRCQFPNRKHCAYKFIGANNSGKWDFTPLISEFCNYPTNTRKDISDRVVYGNDGAGIIQNALNNPCFIIDVAEELSDYIENCSDGKYFWIRDRLTFFYI